MTMIGLQRYEDNVAIGRLTYYHRCVAVIKYLSVVVQSTIQTGNTCVQCKFYILSAFRIFLYRLFVSYSVTIQPPLMHKLIINTFSYFVCELFTVRSPHIPMIKINTQTFTLEKMSSS